MDNLEKVCITVYGFVNSLKIALSFNDIKGSWKVANDMSAYIVSIGPDLTLDTSKKVSSNQLEEWAELIYENCGEGENFNTSLYMAVVEMRELSGYYERSTTGTPDGATDTP